MHISKTPQRHSQRRAQPEHLVGSLTSRRKRSPAAAENWLSQKAGTTGDGRRQRLRLGRDYARIRK